MILKNVVSHLYRFVVFSAQTAAPHFFSAQTAAHTDGPRRKSTPCRQYLGLVKNRAAARNFTGARRLLPPKRLQKDYATPWVAEFTERFVALRRALKLLPKNPCEMHTKTPLGMEIARSSRNAPICTTKKVTTALRSFNS